MFAIIVRLEHKMRFDQNFIHTGFSSYVSMVTMYQMPACPDAGLCLPVYHSMLPTAWTTFTSDRKRAYR